MLRGMSLAYCQALPLQMRSTLCTARSKCPRTGYTSLTSSMTRRRDRPIMPWLHTWIRYSHALTSASQIFFALSSPNAPQVVGNVTTQIRAKGSMWRNTLIVMSSDNVRLRLNGFGPPFLDRFAAVSDRFSGSWCRFLESWRQDGGNGEKTRKNGEKMGEIRPKESGSNDGITANAE